jgi:CDP-diacylglycerol--glycerol-3-phosphate 3-phosphatidyltransferase
VKNLPNLLSAFRILLVPVLVTVLFTKVDGKEWVGLGLFLAAALTDFLDGYLARRWGRVTRLGQILDPAADKILIASAFISLVELNPAVVPAWMVALILAREFAVGALRSVAASAGVVIAAGWSGKVKTVSQIVAVSLLIVHNQLDEFKHLSRISLWIAVAITVFSGVEYLVRFRGQLNASAIPEEPAA